jgi:carboxyl-terminal processing protease
MKQKTSISILAVIILLTGCQKEFFGVETAKSPTATFQYIWTDFKENYGLFAVKNLDWDSLYNVLNAQATDQMTDRELYLATIALLKPLNDKHITLFPASNPELPRWSVDLTDGGIYVTEEFEFEVVKNHYLNDRQEPAPFLQYGRLTPDVGYLHIQHMDGKKKDYEKALDQAFQALENVRGLVLDIRDNSGGYDPTAQYIAGRFAAERKRYMTVRKKSGPGPNDFTSTQEWYVQPEGNSQFTRPVAVLTTGATASAAETFLLALRTQNHITQVGTITSGAFSDAPMREAPNGWTYTLSIGDYRAADGKSYEGIGLQPQLEVKNRKADLAAGRDPALERAIELLR